MNPRLEIIMLDTPAWGSFVKTNSSATAFHHPAWAIFLAECYGYRSFAMTWTDDVRGIIAGLPLIEVHSPLRHRRWISLPFTDYCPPLADDSDSLVALVNHLIHLQAHDGISDFEARAALPAMPSVHHVSDAFRHTLSLLPGTDIVLRKLRPTVRQGIVRSQRDGVSIQRADSLADLRVFYDLQIETRRRLGVPIQPYRFYELLWKRMIEPGLGFLLIASKDRVPIAAAIFLAWNGTVIYKYSASKSQYLKLRPNHLILWKAIEWGCENGYRILDFGRTEVIDQGLRTFKNGWGTQEEPLVYSTTAQRGPRSSSGQLSRWMAIVIRHSPLWVCRALGEILYKYAA